MGGCMCLNGYNIGQGEWCLDVVSYFGCWCISYVCVCIVVVEQVQMLAKIYVYEYIYLFMCAFNFYL